MAAIDFGQFHELAEQFKGKMPQKKIREKEGISYRSYIAWRIRNGVATRRKRKSAEPARMVEMMVTGICAPDHGVDVPITKDHNQIILELSCSWQRRVPMRGCRGASSSS